MATQFHRCNRYCTQNFTQNCKSMFPFAVRDKTRIEEVSDRKGTPHFRLLLRRNNPRINQYSFPILNLWRANMDVTGIIRDAFGAVVYLACYTSKVDKKLTFNQYLQHYRL